MVQSRILVVEDDRDHARALCTRLTREGFAVIVARDACQAVQLARRERPALVILDVRLPAGDGFCVHARLNNLPCGAVPVIYLTGLSGEVHKRRARRLGAAAVLNKPVKSEELVATIRDCLTPQDAPEPALSAAAATALQVAQCVAGQRARSVVSGRQT